MKKNEKKRCSFLSCSEIGKQANFRVVRKQEYTITLYRDTLVPSTPLSGGDERRLHTSHVLFDICFLPHFIGWNPVFLWIELPGECVENRG